MNIDDFNHLDEVLNKLTSLPPDHQLAYLKSFMDEVVKAAYKSGFQHGLGESESFVRTIFECTKNEMNGFFSDAQLVASRSES